MCNIVQNARTKDPLWIGDHGSRFPTKRLMPMCTVLSGTARHLHHLHVTCACVLPCPSIFNISPTLVFVTFGLKNRRFLSCFSLTPKLNPLPVSQSSVLVRQRGHKYGQPARARPLQELLCPFQIPRVNTSLQLPQKKTHLHHDTSYPTDRPGKNMTSSTCLIHWIRHRRATTYGCVPQKRWWRLCPPTLLQGPAATIIW